MGSVAACTAAWKCSGRVVPTRVEAQPLRWIAYWFARKLMSTPWRSATATARVAAALICTLAGWSMPMLDPPAVSSPKATAEAFQQAGLSVWWDQTLTAGEAYDEVTEQALKSAGAVVVLERVEDAVGRVALVRFRSKGHP